MRTDNRPRAAAGGLLLLLSLALGGIVRHAAAVAVNRRTRHGAFSGIAAHDFSRYCSPRRAARAGTTCCAGRRGRWRRSLGNGRWRRGIDARLLDCPLLAFGLVGLLLLR